MIVDCIVDWFQKAVPFPTTKNFNTQIGCHVEEFVEMLEALEAETKEQNDTLKGYITISKEMADKLKKGTIKVTVKDRVGFLDAICDQIVTATGAATYQGMKVSKALKEVALSNESKFVNGRPVFDENKKIIKGPDYFKANLEDFI